ncbi:MULTISPECIES: HNH endonuclease [Bacteroidales]|uniref:HNH domain-containing protein n=1 Tax=Bacteroides muris (ex Afrizal et al. 2022) TaxID=2516960 RepID=A0A4S2AYM2_9BACE|nr:hypothetical protein [Bacteroides uniformis]NVK93203.1 HNH endonuclease [Bacteroides sp. L10-4]RHD61938.1 hypothetical protein DW786_11830 [Bacteroides uniformis]RJU36874.1 hypothetical protein DW947_00135 [Bacteroides sp. AM44-19]TGY06699.1 hypothetical protein E5355_08075 [Bacteroides muris (ex Afrizal et al. 2022)]
MTVHLVHHIINYSTNGKRASDNLIIACLLQASWKRL